MMLQHLPALLLLLPSASSLRIAAPALGNCDRRAAISLPAAAALTLLGPAPAVAAEEKAAAEVLAAQAALKELLQPSGKDAFKNGLSAGDPSAKLPKPVAFTTFQKLEGTSEPEFMEAAIYYMEAFRNARDLVKLAKLTKQQVQVSVQSGDKRETKTIAYGDAEGSALDSAENYAERALKEVLGASLALDEAVKFMH